MNESFSLYCGQKNKTIDNCIVVDEHDGALILDAGWAEYEFYPDTGKLCKFHDHADKKTKIAGVWREL